MQTTITLNVNTVTNTLPTPLGNVVIEETTIEVAILIDEPDVEETEELDELSDTFLEPPFFSVFIFVPKDVLAAAALVSMCLEHFCNFELVESGEYRDTVRVFSPNYECVKAVAAIFNMPEWNIQTI